MKTSLDCISCFTRQAVEAAKLVSDDPIIHEQIVRELFRWVAEMDFAQSPPLLVQRIHRRLREITGVEDPYRAIKERHNCLASSLYPELKAGIEEASDPLAMALRLAVSGNIIDLGAKSGLSDADMVSILQRSVAEGIAGDFACFKKAVTGAHHVLYLADNAGEIVFDRLLIEQLSPDRITIAVRGAPVINDATMVDAESIGLCEIVEVIDNGSDAPGTVIEDCSEAFRRRFEQADLIIAKGQGNYETLSGEAHSIFFLFKVKCSVIAAQVGVPVGTNVVAPSETVFSKIRRAI
jgi:hypothetical protein